MNSYFLGSNAGDGFSGNFDRFLSMPLKRFYIIKGGPGTGKSSFMKRLKADAEKDNDRYEIYPCSSDCESLDGFYNITKNYAVIDGTSPHFVANDLPFIKSEALDFNIFLCAKKLENKKAEIIKINDEIKEYHKKASVYISSAKALRENCYNVSKNHLNLTAVKKAQNAVKTINGKGGTDCTKFFSAVTNKGVYFNPENLKNQENIILCDEFGAAADAIITSLLEKYEGTKKDLCYCSVIRNKKEHLIFENSGVFTSNIFHEIRIDNAVYFNNFYTSLPESLTGDTKTAKELIKKAAKNILEAKKRHDILEKYYINAMNFSGLERYYKKIKKETK